MKVGKGDLQVLFINPNQKPKDPPISSENDRVCPLKVKSD